MNCLRNMIKLYLLASSKNVRHMKTKELQYFILSFAFTIYGLAQEKKVEKADKQYENFAYVDAISIYEKVAEKGFKNEKLLQNLGNAYYFKAELPKAVKWYNELFIMNPDQEAEYYYRYSQSLKSIGNYDKANKMMNEFAKKNKDDIRSQLYENQKNYLEQIKANSGRFEISDAGINSEFSDYGATSLGSKLVFASARDTGMVSKAVFKWTNESFSNLYWAEMNSNGVLGKVERFPKNINSKFHESSAIFSKDGKTMYFTRNNFLNGVRGKDAKKATLLKIYKAVLKEGKWDDVSPLSFNSDQYSAAHPALSPDEKTLYFVSDMPGTLGQSDLFKVTINPDGTYSTPENLGTEINTEGRETFPFISEDNQLYFASDGHPGLGGLDIFVAEKTPDGKYSTVQNVGEPINSPMDDFGFIIKSDTGTGFFTSNREGGKGYDDIYTLKELRKLKCEQILEGTITDPKTGQPLPGAKVSLFSNDFKFLKEVLADQKGVYSFTVECGEIYYIRAEKEDYLTKETKVTIDKSSGKTEYPIALENKFRKIETNTDLAKEFDMPIIHFDFDKSFIRKDAQVELAKILVIMEQYPKIKIDVRSHTDSRQTAKYNDKLSQARAESTINWLIRNGIEKGRLTGRGYGESQLVNHCSDGIKCTEEEHQANRRSEFIVVSME